jgi:hypothetical protein
MSSVFIFGEAYWIRHFSAVIARSASSLFKVAVLASHSAQLRPQQDIKLLSIYLYLFGDYFYL